MMINATEMAKPFGPNKRPYQWLRLPSTKEYLDKLKSTAQKVCSTPVLTIGRAKRITMRTVKEDILNLVYVYYNLRDEVSKKSYYWKISDFKCIGEI